MGRRMGYRLNPLPKTKKEKKWEEKNKVKKALRHAGVECKNGHAYPHGNRKCIRCSYERPKREGDKE